MKWKHGLFFTLFTLVFSSTLSNVTVNTTDDSIIGSIASYDANDREASFSPCNLCWKPVQFDSNEVVIGSLDGMIQEEALVSAAANQLVLQNNLFYFDAETTSYGIYTYKRYCRSGSECQASRGKLMSTLHPFIDNSESPLRPSQLGLPFFLSNCGHCTLRWIKETDSLPRDLLFPKIADDFIRFEDPVKSPLILTMNVTDKLLDMLKLELIDLRIVSSSMDEKSYPRLEFAEMNESIDLHGSINETITINTTRQVNVTFPWATNGILNLLPVSYAESRSLLLEKWPVNYTISSFADEKIDSQLSAFVSGKNVSLSNERTLDVTVNKSIPPSTSLRVFSNRIVKHENVSFSLTFKVNQVSTWSVEETKHAISHLFGSKVQPFIQADDKSSVLLSFPSQMMLYDESMRIFLNQTPVKNILVSSSAPMIASSMSILFSLLITLF